MKQWLRLAWALVLVWGVAVSAQPGPWQAEIDAFVAEDQLQPPVADGLLFVGSSSIRLWDGLETQFPGWTAVVRRGFGGARMADCAHHWRELVLAQRPRQVVVYAGDNDLAGGRTPQQVLASFREFAQGVQQALPRTRIAFVAIKPSPLRARLMPAMREANAAIAAYVSGRSGLTYIDVYTPMLDARGAPRQELFLADGLHMNAAGYALWRDVITQQLR